MTASVLIVRCRLGQWRLTAMQRCPAILGVPRTTPDRIQNTPGGHIEVKIATGSFLGSLVAGNLVSLATGSK